MPGGAGTVKRLFLYPFVRCQPVWTCPVTSIARPIADEPRRRFRLPPPPGPHPRSGPRRKSVAVVCRPGDEGGGQGQRRSANPGPVERREAARGLGREGKVLADRTGPGRRRPAEAAGGGAFLCPAAEAGGGEGADCPSPH